MPELSDKLCECGCGQRTSVADRTRYGVARGEPRRFVRGHRAPRGAPEFAPAFRPCGCGCGELVVGLFVLGHNPSKRGRRTPAVNPSRECFCGCGGQTSSVDCRWLIGHRNRKAAVEYVVDERGCWIWQLGSKRGGYGAARVEGRQVSAHRMVWERERGPIASDLELHHRCGVPSCVNPAHLEALSTSEHARLHAALRWPKDTPVASPARTGVGHRVNCGCPVCEALK